MPVDGQVYARVYLEFFQWLKLWVARFTYQGVFGHSQSGASRKPVDKVRNMHQYPAASEAPVFASTPATSYAPAPAPVSSPISPPTYADMLAIPEEVSLRHLHTSAAAKAGVHGRPQFTALEEYAPTGKKRTWTWMQRTKPAKPGSRMACNGPPPATCTDPKIKYYGDWLDSQDLCSFCEKPGHVKTNCVVHQNTAKLTVEYSRRKATGLPWPLTPEELKKVLNEESTNSHQTA